MADLVSRIRDRRQKLAAAGPPYVRADGDFEDVAVPAAECEILHDVMLREAPTIVIEIGLAYASSALAIAQALVEASPGRARHIIIDAYQTRAFHDAGWDALIEAGLGDVCTLIQERSHIGLSRLLADGMVADAAFIDGSHLFHNVFVELFYLRELVRPGGLLILDDCQYPSVATAVRYFQLNIGWQPEPLTPGTRLRAFRLPDALVDPSFEAFKPFGQDSRRGDKLSSMRRYPHSRR